MTNFLLATSLPPDFFGRIWFILQKYGASMAKGAGTTLAIAIVGTFIGCVIGFIVGLIQTIPINPNDSVFKKVVLRIVNVILKIYVEVFRGTPMMVQAMFLHYGAMILFNLNMGMWMAAFVIVSINTGAYMAESVRGGIISIDPGQTEGAKAIGMTHVQTMVNVIMPQALRNIIPQIGNNFIINIKDTSVMFVIGFVEFFATHRNIVGVNLLYFPSAIIEMVGYLTLTLLSSFGLQALEKWLDGDANYELVSVDSLAMSAGTYSHPSRKTPFDEQSKEFKETKKSRKAGK